MSRKTLRMIGVGGLCLGVGWGAGALTTWRALERVEDGQRVAQSLEATANSEVRRAAGRAWLGAVDSWGVVMFGIPAALLIGGIGCAIVSALPRPTPGSSSR